MAGVRKMPYLKKRWPNVLFCHSYSFWSGPSGMARRGKVTSYAVLARRHTGILTTINFWVATVFIFNMAAKKGEHSLSSFAKCTNTKELSSISSESNPQLCYKKSASPHPSVWNPQILNSPGILRMRIRHVILKMLRPVPLNTKGGGSGVQRPGLGRKGDKERSVKSSASSKLQEIKDQLSSLLKIVLVVTQMKEA